MRAKKFRREGISAEQINESARQQLAAMEAYRAIAPSEEEQICAGMSVAAAVIDRMTDALKASQSGASQPREVLRQMLTKGSNCSCRVANYLLEQERKEREH